MSMTYYTVDDLRLGRSGWGVKRFSTLNDAISHYQTLPMDGARVLGMADDTHTYELIRCVRLSPAMPRARMCWQQITGAAAW